MIAPGFWLRSEPTRLARALRPLGALYGAATARRMRGQGARVTAPTICVGNFVVGGAGKTPTAIAIARALQKQGRRVAFLSRGYGGAKRAAPTLVDPSMQDAGDVGDEPLLLARVAPCYVARDRAAAARAAIEAGAEVLILDDGLQNPALAKDLSFAVVDGEVGFGNGLCFPAGPLRAPVASQAPLADALIVIGADDAQAASIGATAPEKPLFRARLEPDAVAAAQFIGRPVFAFAGIARPQKFYATLSRLGAQVAATRDFPDHHRFTPREIDALAREAADRGLLLATTEKDEVRLPPRYAREAAVLPVSLQFDDPQGLAKLIDQAIGRSTLRVARDIGDDPAG